MTATVERHEEHHAVGGISMAQLLGGALAAVTSAVAASYLGVAGTFIGAAVGSIVYTIAAAVYETFFSRAARASKTLVARTAIAPGSAHAGRSSSPTAVPVPVTQAANGGDRSGGTGGEVVRTYRAGESEPVWRRLHWKRLALAAGIVFVGAMALITISELVLGHPLGNSKGSGTTITNLDGRRGSTPASTPSGTSSVNPSTGATATPSSIPAGTSGESAAPSPTGTSGATSSDTATTQPAAPVPSGSVTSNSVGPPKPSATP
ncbi:MAG TPA: hypothetical protein VMT69_18105 [Kineosporiaceae bacterium]|nr:hypothetical protein [Kineosporiaceae bacterium]